MTRHLAFLTVLILACAAGAQAQNSTIGGGSLSATGAPTTLQSTGASPLDAQDQRLKQEFAEQHPNWAKNHPKLANFYKNHPQAQDRSLDKYGQRQWGQSHPNWVENHPKLAKFDYRHPEWTENHPRKALGGGRGLLGRGGMGRRQK